MLRNRTRGEHYRVQLSLDPRQRRMVLAGGLLPMMRERLGGS